MRGSLTANKLIELCHRVHSRGMVSGSGGNISFRVDENYLITPTGRSLGFINESEIVTLDKEGTYVGNIKPSKEYLLHLNCYKERPECNVVVHVHSVYAVAISCLPNLDMKCAMPIFTPGYALRVGKLPVVPYLHPGSEILAQQVKNAIFLRKSVLLANHGFVTLGTTPEEAMGIAEEIEENAKIFFLLKGNANPLSQASLNKLGVL